MERQRKLKVAVGAAAAVAVAGSGAAIAAAQAGSPREEREAVVDDAARLLGIQPNALSNALKQAFENRVDEAVAGGRLTEEQGERLKERIESGELPLLGAGFGLRRGAHFELFGKLEAAASYLGLTEDALRAQLEDGKTLAEVARDQDKSVDGLVDALTDAAEQKLDDAVAAGRLTEAQKESIQADIKERITDLVNGEHGRPGFGFRFGPGFRQPEAPPTAA